MNDLLHTIQTHYTYDSLNRLTAAEAEDGSALTYQYDKCGNPTVTGQQARVQQVVAAPVAPVAPQPPETSAKTVMMTATPMTASLIVLNGSLAHQQIPLGERLRLGREVDNELPLPDLKISRYHALIERQGQQYQITDLDSSNGTYVNRERITTPTPLKNGDVILVGEIELTFSDQP
ncbi:MAG: FHA domain-containing protein [Anaerolineae bacterium]|jgi:YD repeat-containing protein|nr:FHA domain-containing protein [Anaerolineae bacterium]